MIISPMSCFGDICMPTGTERCERAPNPEIAAIMGGNTDDQRHDISASDPTTLFHPCRRRSKFFLSFSLSITNSWFDWRESRVRSCQVWIMYCTATVPRLYRVHVPGRKFVAASDIITSSSITNLARFWLAFHLRQHEVKTQISRILMIVSHREWEESGRCDGYALHRHGDPQHRRSTEDREAEGILRHHQ